jgi:phospholipid transport system substrate-binding protein
MPQHALPPNPLRPEASARRRFLAAMALLGFAFLLLAPRVHAAAQTPGQMVLENSQRVIRTLSERRAEFQANPDALHGFIRSEFTSMFDRVYAARLVLGRNSRGVSDAEVRAFADALAENLMQRYGNSLLEVDPGLNVKVVSEVALRGGTIVKVMSLIDRRSGAPVPVDYLMHRNGGQWQVFDVLVEGVSFVQTFRTQFDDELRTKTVAQLTADLRAGRIRVDAAVDKK